MSLEDRFRSAALENCESGQSPALKRYVSTRSHVPEGEREFVCTLPGIEQRRPLGER